MSLSRNAADIIPGSLWLTPDETTSALVITASAGYVCFQDATDGAVRTLHGHRFREMYREPYDARYLRSQFSMSLANLASFHAFWSPSEGKMYARSSNIVIADCYRAARGRPALPADAEYVETYSDPVITEPRWHRKGLRGVEAFFDDLHDVLARIFQRGRSTASV